MAIENGSRLGILGMGITVAGLLTASAVGVLGVAPPASFAPCEMREGGIIQGPLGEKRIALVFTGHEFAEGGDAILDALSSRQIRASFFVTGDFARASQNAPLLRRIAGGGHLLGPHSDRHLLYAPWTGEKKTLVSREEFRTDLDRNFAALAPFDVTPEGARFWVPPYEWWTAEIAAWSREMGFVIASFTPGTRANADYTGESEPNFVSSAAIVESILAREREDPAGLNGFILLMHVGAGPSRADKLPSRLGGLLDALSARGYRFGRLDDLLAGCTRVKSK